MTNLRTKRLFFIIFIACISFVCFSCENKKDGKASFFEPFYANEYKDEYFQSCSDINKNIYNFNRRTVTAFRMNKCPCIPVSDINANERSGVLCIADWSGGTLDLWAVFRESSKSGWSRPYFTGLSVLDKAPDSCSTNTTENDMNKVGNGIRNKYGIIMIERIDSRFKDNYLIVSLKYMNIPGKSKESINLKTIKSDKDKDKLTDILEKRFGTSPIDPDTDQDGITDANDSNPQSSLLTIFYSL
jgi:hypothetical protein